MSRTPFCVEHQSPKVQVRGQWVCPIERIFQHLGGQQVKDLIPSLNEITTVSLVFANSHTLPIYCPDCGGSVYFPEETETRLVGQFLVGAAYQKSSTEDGTLVNAVVLFFGGEEALKTEEGSEDLYPLYCHLNTARRLGCPTETLAEQERTPRPAPHRPRFKDEKE